MAEYPCSVSRFQTLTFNAVLVRVLHLTTHYIRILLILISIIFSYGPALNICGYRLYVCFLCSCSFQIPTDMHPATKKSSLETVLTVLLHKLSFSNFGVGLERNHFTLYRVSYFLHQNQTNNCLKLFECTLKHGICNFGYKLL